jgi:hypothetical protein
VEFAKVGTEDVVEAKSLPPEPEALRYELETSGAE